MLQLLHKHAYTKKKEKTKKQVWAQTGTRTTTRHVIGARAVKSAVPVWVGRQKKKKTCHWLLGHRTSVFDVTVRSSTTTAPRPLVNRKLMSMLEERGRQKASVKLKLSSISFIYHHASEFTQSAKGTESAIMSSIEMLAMMTKAWLASSRVVCQCKLHLVASQTSH